jgi:uncharacterized protein YlxP (DUF503 family)
MNDPKAFEGLLRSLKHRKLRRRAILTAFRNDLLISIARIDDKDTNLQYL